FFRAALGARTAVTVATAAAAAPAAFAPAFTALAGLILLLGLVARGLGLGDLLLLARVGFGTRRARSPFATLTAPTFLTRAALGTIAPAFAAGGTLSAFRSVAALGPVATLAALTLRTLAALGTRLAFFLLATLFTTGFAALFAARLARF